jgi:GTP-binding protein HflX
VADQLFATLDPTSRRLRFPAEREAIITDTVGFIRDLPADLIKAFRATLEELEVADLLLHVIDIADPMQREKMETVDNLLSELELDGIPRVVVYNKSELVPAFQARAMSAQVHGVAVSAHTGAGLMNLVELIAQRLWQTDALLESHLWAEKARSETVDFAGARP